MNSNILSRFLPPTGSPSVYETIRQHDADSDASDPEERAGMALGGHQSKDFSDRELEEAMADDKTSRSPSPGTEYLTPEQPLRSSGEGHGKAHPRRRLSRHPRWMRSSPSANEGDEGDEGDDDDVPASLLVEGHQDNDNQRTNLPPPPRNHFGADASVPGPSSDANRVHWEATKTHQPLHHSNTRKPHPVKGWVLGQHPNLAMVDPKEKAMWRWANVENLDNFVRDVYTYFLGNGIWSILLTRALNLLYVCNAIFMLTFHCLEELTPFLEPLHLLWASRPSSRTVSITIKFEGARRWTIFSFRNARRRCLYHLPFCSGCSLSSGLEKYFSIYLTSEGSNICTISTYIYSVYPMLRSKPSHGRRLSAD